MSSWFGVLRRKKDADTTKTLSTAAVKAEASVLVGEIRDNLDRLEDAIDALPDDDETVRETGADD